MILSIQGLQHLLDPEHGTVQGPEAVDVWPSQNPLTMPRVESYLVPKSSNYHILMKNHERQYLGLLKISSYPLFPPPKHSIFRNSI